MGNTEGKEKTDTDVYNKLFAENDPKIRKDVIAALRRRHIGRIDPFLLELSMRYHWDHEYKKPEEKSKDTKLRRQLIRHILRTVRDIQKYPAESRYIVINNLIDLITQKWYRYSAYDSSSKQSDWTTQNQPDAKDFLKLLRQKQDPRFVALLMVNIWGSKYQFHECANIVGHGVLSWDDARSLKFKERMAHAPENLHLCENISVQASGIVAIEPFNEYKDFDYDLYGSTIAEVTSYAISFVPKSGVDPRTLQKHVEAAIDQFCTQGEVLFTAPNAEYNNPHNAYDRPKIFTKESYKDYSYGIRNDPTMSFMEVYADWSSKHPSQVKKHKAFFDALEAMKDAENHLASIAKEEKVPEGVPADLWFTLISHLLHQQTYQELLTLNKHTTVNNDGHVVLNKALILDDVLELYKFCNGFLTPSEQVAHTINAARHAEECGPLKQVGDIRTSSFHHYSSSHMSMHDRLGNMYNVAPEDMVDKALHDMMVLTGHGQSLELTFLQAAVIAHGTFTGALPDGTGRYPSLRQITKERDGRSDNHSLPALAQSMIEDRTRNILSHAAEKWGYGDSDIPLKERFEQASRVAAEVLNYNQKIQDICDKYIENTDRYTRHKNNDCMLDNLLEGDNEDKFALREERAYALTCLEQQKPYTPRMVARLLFDRLEGRKDGRRYDDKTTYIKEIDTKTQPPEGLDVLEQFMWRRCRDLILEGKGQDEPETEKHKGMAIRGNVALWGGEIPPQLPRGFDDTSYTTRDRRLPFARPETQLPPELEKLTKHKGQDKREPLSLPDPTVIWGQTNPKTSPS